MLPIWSWSMSSGVRKQVKVRQTVYFPFLIEAQAGTLEAPVVDLGCGRGGLALLCDQQNDRSRIGFQCGDD